MGRSTRRNTTTTVTSGARTIPRRSMRIPGYAWSSLSSTEHEPYLREIRQRADTLTQLFKHRTSDAFKKRIGLCHQRAVSQVKAGEASATDCTSRMRGDVPHFHQKANGVTNVTAQRFDGIA